MPSSKAEDFFKQFISTASDIVKVLAVGAKPVLKYDGFRLIGRDEISSLLKDVVIFSGKYSGPIHGNMYILLSEELSRKLAGSLMGSGYPDKFGPAEKSAIFELMNNIMGRWIPLWDQVVKGNIKIESQELHGIGEKVSVTGDKWFYVKANCVIDNEDFGINIFIPGEDVDIIEGEPQGTVKSAREVKMAEDKYKDPLSKDEPHEEEAQDAQEPVHETLDKISSHPHDRLPAEKTSGSQPTVTARKATFQQLGEEQRREVNERPIELILDVPLLVSVELGRKDLTIKEILELSPGSIIELDQLAGEPVDLMVNGKLFARGEVVVIDENFGVRVTNIISPQERLEKMR